ncbi:MAG: DoxX family protein [Ignavibacteria bacterium]|nr:DoxX family protein [Ignavibacteria bacterium]
MSLLFKARSGSISSSVGIFLIRISLGFLFLLAGAGKVLNLQDFIKSVQDTGQMNNTVAFVLAFILPFMEMIFGALFIIGLFTPVTSFFMACMTVSFLMVLGFGHEELPYSYNIVFLACFISTMFTGAGLISFDALGDRKKEEVAVRTGNENVSSGSKVYEQPKATESETIYVDEKDVKDTDVNG